MKFFSKIFQRTPSIVALGGGTGLSTLLRGLKAYSDKITAVCTVADDGGSSGRMRKDLDILPPGDIRNCLVALSDMSPLLESLFQYRFEESDLRGHSFGNIFLAALARVTGDFHTAIQEANQILNVRGQVLPATSTKVALVAHHPDGSKSTGESFIGARKAGKRIERITLKPEPDPAHPKIIEAILQADLIVLGPGSLYTSIIPNLMVTGILPALSDSQALCAYVCNVMTQPGETYGYSAADHVEALIRHATPGLLDFVVLNQGDVSEEILAKYEQQGAIPVDSDEGRLKELSKEIQIVRADIVSSDDLVRHDSDKLARVLMETYQEIVKERSKLPSNVSTKS